MQERLLIQNVGRGRRRPAVMPGRLPISACFIIRNEGQFLQTCLASIAGLVDELIVCDTGSTDGSVSIAEGFGARVEPFTWMDDFSAARNYCLSLARCPWILVLDGDESVEHSHRDVLSGLVAGDAVAYYVNRRHYISEFSPGGVLPLKEPFPPLSIAALGYTQTRDVRLFRNWRGFHYEGQVHESIETSIWAQGGTIEESSVIVHHYGGLKSSLIQAEKKQLYTKLGALKARDRPDCWKTIHEYGVELSSSGQFERAIAVLTEGLQNHPEQRELLLQLGVARLMTGEVDAAIGLLHQVVNQAPAWLQGWSGLGFAFLEAGLPDSALICFQQCQAICPGDAVSLAYLVAAAVLTKEYSAASLALVELDAQFPGGIDRSVESIHAIVARWGTSDQLEWLSSQRPIERKPHG